MKRRIMPYIIVLTLVLGGLGASMLRLPVIKAYAANAAVYAETNVYNGIKNTVQADYTGDIEISFKLRDNPGIYGFEAVIGFDRAFVYKSDKSSPSFNNSTSGFRQETSLKIIADENPQSALDPVTENPVTFLTVVFTLRPGTAAGVYNFTFSQEFMSDIEGEEIPVVLENFSIEVTSVSTGSPVLYAETSVFDGEKNAVPVGFSDEIRVDFKLKNNPGIYGIESMLSFDNNFIYEREASSSTFNNSVSGFRSATGLKIIADENPQNTLEPVIAEPALLLSVFFKLNAGAPANTYSFAFYDEFVSDINGDEVTIAVESFTVEVVASSSDKSISSLKVNDGTDIPNSAGTYTSQTVAYLDTTANVTAVVAGTATLKIGGQDAQSGVSKTVNLVAGMDTTISIEVTAEDDSTAAYTLVIPREAPSTDKSITSLKVNGGTDITPSGNVYTSPVQVAYNAAAATITAVIPTTATMTIGGSAATSGTAKSVNLTPGSDTTISIIVTAQDSTTATYSVLIPRAPAASDNNIISLKVNNGSDIVPVGKTYTSPVQVAYSASTATITAVIPATATMTIGGTAAQSGVAKSVSLTAGADTSITVVVTAQDAVAETYTVVIPREAGSSEKQITQLKIDNNIVAEIGGEYKYSIPYAKNSVTITATASQNATMKIDNAAWDGTAKIFSGITVGEKTIVITVTAQDGSTADYDVIITREAASDDKSITSLKVNEGAALTPSGTTYTSQPVSLSASTATVTAVIPSTSTMTIAGEAAQSGAAKTVALTPGGETVITIIVTAENKTTETYTVVIPREAGSSEKEITELKIDGKVIASSGGEYRYTIPYAKSAVSIAATASQNASMKIDGTAWNGSSKDFTGLIVGERTIVITVIAQDSSESEYHVIITREEPSSDKAISSLKVNNGAELSPSDTTYTSQPVSLTAPTATITAVIPATATMTMDGEIAQSGAAKTVALSAGSSTITIIVTAQDGTTASYTVVIPREAGSSEKEITMLKIDGNDITPSGSVYSYTIPYSKTSASIAASASQYASMKIDGTEWNGASMLLSSLTTGDNTFTITVTAQDGTTADYSVVITRTAADANTELADTNGLVVRNNGVVLSGTWSGDKYVIQDPILGAERGKITVSAIPKSSKSTLLINSKAANPDEETSITGLIPGQTNIIKVTVTAESGAVKTYDIEIDIEALDSNADLASITISYLDDSGIPVTPDFDPGVVSYKANVISGTTQIKVTAAAASEKAEIVSGTGTITLSGSLTVVTIKVKAEDGSEKIYSIAVSGEGISDNNRIRLITLENIPFTFSQSTYEYELEVPYYFENANISVTTESAEAGVFGAGERELSDGLNELRIYAVAGNGTRGEDYILKITRLTKEDVDIFKFEIKGTSESGDEYPISVSVDKDTKEYTITLPNKVNKVNILAELEYEYPDYIIEGAGEHELVNYGLDNPDKFVVKVKNRSDNSVAAEYTISVLRDNSGTGGESPVYKALTYVFGVVALGLVFSIIVLAYNLARAKKRD